MHYTILCFSVIIAFAVSLPVNKENRVDDWSNYLHRTIMPPWKRKQDVPDTFMPPLKDNQEKDAGVRSTIMPPWKDSKEKDDDTESNNYGTFMPPLKKDQGKEGLINTEREISRKN